MTFAVSGCFRDGVTRVSWEVKVRRQGIATPRPGNLPGHDPALNRPSAHRSTGAGYGCHCVDRSGPRRGRDRQRGDHRSKPPAVTQLGGPVNGQVAAVRASGTTRMPARLTADDYDGRTPFAVRGRPPGTVQGWARVGGTIRFVVVPFAGLAAAAWLAWGHGLHFDDVLLALAFYVITGLGVTVGFHRLLTHRSFTAVPALRVALAIAGSMSFEGEAIGWGALPPR